MPTETSPQWNWYSSLLSPSNAAGIVLLGFVLVGLVQTIGLDQGSQTARAEEPGSNEISSQLDMPNLDYPTVLREGAELNEVIGEFKLIGARIHFVTQIGQNQTKLCCTENLMLHRVADMIQNQSSQLTWQISGEVTEFQGKNYITLHQASRRSK